VTVPDLRAVEAHHAAVVAALTGKRHSGFMSPKAAVLLIALADRALARLQRHAVEYDVRHPGTCDACVEPKPCPDALDAWADLTDIGTTYGVTP
jgi:hypothetical protein